MNEAEREEQNRKVQEELDKIFKENKNSDMFEVPIVVNLRLIKMRYLSYRQVMNLIETRAEEAGENPTKMKEDFIVSCFCAGLDHMILDITKKLIGNRPSNTLDDMMGKD